MSQTESAAAQGELSPDTIKTIRWTAFGLFLAAATVAAIGLFVPSLGDSGGLAAVLVLLTATTTLCGMSRQLPAQNILLAATVVAVIGSGSQFLGAKTGIPFGPFNYTSDAGPQLMDGLAWFVPFLWIIALFNSRGVARLILRPWRKIRAYGFWLIGLTVVLTLLLDLGIEPFANRVKHYWLWRPSKINFDWAGTPASNFLGWMVTAIIIMAFCTPALMKRKPGSSQADYQPLFVWQSLNLLFILGAATQHLWLAAGVSAAAGLVAAVFAVRGGQW